MAKNVILYSTGCPKCKVLEIKLERAGVVYDTNTDVDAMQALGILEAPTLSVDGRLLSFGEAVRWADSQKE